MRDDEASQALANGLSIPPLVAAVLVQRGYADPDAAHHFLHPSLDDLHDPRLLPDFEVAQREILGAKERGEKVYVHGDYDVDGVTSAALLSRFLESVGVQVITHVPHRVNEGYGVSFDRVKEAVEVGASVFLTCDCGISAHAELAAAREAGLRVVVTDHHTVGATLPDVHAIVNPHRKDSTYPFKELSGAGVAFKLAAGIADTLGFSRANFYRAFLDLAVLGTVADVMPLVDENRIIARFGLEQLFQTKKVGLRALMRTAGAGRNGRLTTYDIGYVLGPRLNAAGRLDDARLSLECLLERDEARAEEIAYAIEQINDQRKSEQVRIQEEAIARVEHERLHEEPLLVLDDAKWHPGLIGLVAGRLVERYGRPVFVISVDEAKGVGKGSGRSVGNFHLADAIRAHSGLIEGGGHAKAAGFSVALDQIEEAKRQLIAYARERIRPEDLTPVHEADLAADYTELNLEGAEALEMLQPFGEANPYPTFAVYGLRLEDVAGTKNEECQRIRLGKKGHPSTTGFAWRMRETLDRVGPQGEVDAIVKLEVNEYNGRRSAQFGFRDLRVHSSEEL